MPICPTRANYRRHKKLYTSTRKMYVNNFQKQDSQVPASNIPKHLTPYEASKYKTEICWNYANGTCKFGPRCKFAHGKHELRHFNYSGMLQKKAQEPRRLCLSSLISDEARDSVKHCSTNVGQETMANVYAILKQRVRNFEVDESSTISDAEMPKHLTMEQIKQFREQDSWSSIGTNCGETSEVDSDMYIEDYEANNIEKIQYETKYGMIHFECEKPILRRTVSCPVLG